tara:strand:- start:732 stop:2045 length:1314 start_codon:yes stop_codon:yes gene_type:complete
MFNLNIDEYSTSELEELFSLSGIQYSKETLKNAYLRSANQTNHTNTSREFTSQMKKDTNLFLEKVYNSLLSSHSQNKSIPQDETNTIFSHTNFPVIKPPNSTMSPNSKMEPNKGKKNIITIDSRFRDDIKSKQGNFNISLKETFNNVNSMTIDNLNPPDKIIMISEQLGNNFFTIDIGGDRQVITLPDFTQNFSTKRSFIKIIIFLRSFKKKMDNIGGLFTRLTLLPQSIIDFGNGDVDITDSEILTNPLFANNPDILSDNLSFSLDTEDMFIDDIPQYISLDFGKTINDNDDPTDIRKKLGNILGFRSKVYTEPITLEKRSASIKGDGQLNLNYVEYGYLIIDDFQTNGEVNIYGNDLTYSGCQTIAATSGKIMTKIDFGRGVGTGIDRFTNIPREYTGFVNINKFHISLIDEFGRTLDLDNNDWSFTMMLNTKKN